MQETIYKCDRCKKIIPDWDFDQIMYLNLRTDGCYKTVELCEEYHNELVDWFER